MSRLSRVLAAVAVIAVCAACTAPGAADPQQTSYPTTQDKTAPSDGTVTEATSVADTGETGATSTGSSATQPTETTPSTTTSTDPPLPGGVAGRPQLTTWLDGAGRLILDRERAGQDGGADPLCAYLFGTPAEVAALALLSGEVALDPISGAKITEDAVLIACVYSSDGAAALVLQVSSGAPIDPDLPGHPLIVTADQVQAVLSYAPGRAGAGIAAVTARRWLAEAAARVTVDAVPSDTAEDDDGTDAGPTGDR